MVGRIATLTLATLALAGCDGDSSPIRVSGSSTVYPFTKAVAEAFAAADTGRKAPLVTSTGTEEGIARFCAGATGEFPDIADASRSIRRSEYAKCQANKVRDIIEVPIGLDGIALVESTAGPKLALTRKDLYLALAANPMGKPNTARTWKDVNPALPAVAIQVLGPPPGSGTRDMFAEMMLQAGCLQAMPEAKAMMASGHPAVLDKTCRQIRTDSAYVPEGEDDSVIVRGLERNPNAIGLLGYSYLEKNAAKLRGVPIEGVVPDNATISSGKYVGGRTLYLYVKKRNLEAKPELKEFLNLYASMWGPGGALVKQGLIAMSDKARDRSKRAIDEAKPMDGTFPQ